MTASAIRTPSQPSSSSEVKRSGLGTSRRVSGLHVVNLKGSYYEMGHQHGSLLAKEILEGPLPYYQTYIRKILKTGGLGAAAPLVATLLRRLVGGQVAKALPDFATEALRGLADGSGIPYKDIISGCVMPDSLVWAASRNIQIKGVDPAVRHRLALGIGCSSALAWGDATTDGKLLHGRNFDYHGVETWTKTAGVMFHDPDEGQPYVAVGAAGILMGGVTAMNQAGLTLTVHQHMFTGATSLGGTPIGIVGDLIMRKAETLDDAERILAAHTPIGCWTYIIADGKTREVLCHEESPKRQVNLRFGAGKETHFSYANIYLDPELGKTERNLYGSYWRANLGRQQRLTTRLESAEGSLDANGIASILADTGGTSCRLHKSIAMLMTVGSVVFRPEDRVLWVATGEAPVSHNLYEPFSLDSRDHAPELGCLDGGVPDDKASARAFEAYRRAYLAYFDDDNVAKARTLMSTSCSEKPEEPLYHHLSGLLALRAGDTEAAAKGLARTIELGHPDEERMAASFLWRGRTSDLRGLRDEATSDYRTVLGLVADPAVTKAARLGLRQRYSKSQARGISVDFAFADVMTP
jgi:hypothetical protein